MLVCHRVVAVTFFAYIINVEGSPLRLPHSLLVLHSTFSNNYNKYLRNDASFTISRYLTSRILITSKGNRVLF